MIENMTSFWKFVLEFFFIKSWHFALFLKSSFWESLYTLSGSHLFGKVFMGFWGFFMGFQGFTALLKQKSRKKCTKNFYMLHLFCQCLKKHCFAVFDLSVNFSSFYLWGSSLLEDPSRSLGFLLWTCSTIQSFICCCRSLSGIGLKFHPTTPRKHFYHIFLSFS